MFFMGIDPGVTGAFAVINDKEEIISASLYEATKLFKFPTYVTLACIEKVNAMPRQGLVSTWTFAQNYGYWQGLLAAYGVRYIKVTPQKWQKSILDFIPARKAGDSSEGVKQMRRRLADNKKALKNGIVEFVKRRIKNADTYIVHKKDYGIADALCLALYAKNSYLV